MATRGASGGGGGPADASEYLLRERVPEAIADAAGSATEARAECPHRHMADCLAGRLTQQQQQQQQPGPDGEPRESAAAYRKRHGLAAAVSGALSALSAARPLPQRPRRWLSAHFALAAEAAAERAARAVLSEAELGERDGLRGALSTGPSAAGAATPAQGAAEGSAAGGARRGSCLWKAEVAEDVRAALQGLRHKVKQLQDELAAYVLRVPAELAVELREGMLELQRSTAELARCAVSATPPAAAVGDQTRFGEGIELKPKQQQRPYRFHEDCEGGEEDVVPDPPLLAAAPSWPGEWRPPPRWGQCTITAPAGGVALHAEQGAEPVGRAEEGTRLSVLSDAGEWLRVEHGGGQLWAPRAAFAPEQLTAARLRVAQEGLAALRSAPGAPLAASAVAQVQQEQQQQGGNNAHKAPSMLDWLFALPAQWATADLGDTFGHFRTWKYSAVRFIELGGSRFHPCDIVCNNGRHLPRTGGTRTCCAVGNALEVLQRILAGVEPAFQPMEWPKYAQWVADGRKGQSPEPPGVPARALAEMSAHDAIEGVLACFLYSYNLQCPNDFNALRMLPLPGEGPPGWQLSGLCVKIVASGSRAEQAKVRAKDVVVSLGGAAVASDAEVAELAGQAKTVGVVAARCQPRPLQLFSAVNWAMREVPFAGGDSVRLLRRALSVFKPFIWRLDRFIRLMEKRPAVLFRGLAKVRTARHYEIGTQLVFAAFTSLSENAAVAWKFAGEDGGTWQSLQALLALDVAFCSQFPGEREQVLGSNTPVRVVDKPTDDIQSTLGTTNDVVSMVQEAAARPDSGRSLPNPPRPVRGARSKAARGAWRETARRRRVLALSEEAVLEQRIKGLRSQQVMFRTFDASYVEPRVRREADDTELRLGQAFEEFADSDAQWCVLVGSPGEGKSSALLWLYGQALAAAGGGKRRVPLFVSMPLVPRITEEEGWLRRQVSTQLHVGQPGWDLLTRRQMAVFADSADESGAAPAALRERSLAARSELPPASKCCVSVRDEDMRRMGLTPEDLGGRGCTVLQLLPFGDSERGRFCRHLGERAAGRAVERLGQAKAAEEEGRHEALRELPGCRPADGLLEAMHKGALRGDKGELAALMTKYAEEAAALTERRLARLDPSATGSTLLYAMAAEAAHELPEGADDAAVIEAALLRRMRRGAARVDPAAWAAAGAHSAEERVEALMRAAEAVAAALILSEQWNGRISAAAEAAAPLCEVQGGAAALLPLFPGLPLRTASAEDAACPFALPHRRVQEWLAGRWAERAAWRGCGAEALKVVRKLSDWAGANRTAAAVAQRVAEALTAAAERAVAEGAERGPAMRPAMEARIAALRQQGDKEAAAAELQRAAAECEELYGEDALTAEALASWGLCLSASNKRAEAVAPLRRGLQLRVGLLGAEHADTLSVQFDLAFALTCSGGLAEAEELFTAARAAAQPGSAEELDCITNLAGLLCTRGKGEQALSLFREALERRERLSGREHPSTLAAANSAAIVLERLSRWAEALPLFRRAYLRYRKVMPRGNPHVASAAWSYASALYRAALLSGQAAERDEAEALLRAEGLWEERQKQVAQNRRYFLRQYRERGAAGYGALLRGEVEGEDNEREWCMWQYPEMVAEVDEQLRRLSAGREPYDDALGNAKALYRTGQLADRAAAEALLRAEGLWEERQKEVAHNRRYFLGQYRERGAAGYGALLRGEVEGEDYTRELCMREYPELVAEVDEQLRRIAEGLPPFPEEAPGGGSAQEAGEAGQ